jgi:hypothetical protein
VNPLPILSPEKKKFLHITVGERGGYMIYNGLIEIQIWNFLHLLRQEIKMPLLRLISTLSQTLPTTDALVWMTTRISLPQSTRNLGEIVVATAANISRRSGKALRVKIYTPGRGICHWHFLDRNVRHVTLNMFGCYTVFTLKIHFPLELSCSIRKKMIKSFLCLSLSETFEKNMGRGDALNCLITRSGFLYRRITHASPDRFLNFTEIQQ